MPDMLTADGRIVHLRPVQSGDAAELSTLHSNASTDSQRMRFFGLGDGLIGQEVQRVTRTARDGHHAIAAFDGPTAIGLASYEPNVDSATAEFAVLVADAWQGRGVGTLLLEQLAAHARQHGVKELVGDVLPANNRMARVAAGLAPSGHQQLDLLRIPTDFDDAALSALDARERVAEEHSLRSLLAPQSVAVVGVSRSLSGIGRQVVANLLSNGFRGRLYAVSPHTPHIDGCLTVASVAELPENVDLLVVAVPADLVAQVLQESRARAAIVLTAGFSEDGPDGAARQQEVLRVARQKGIRILGPNCLGAINTDPQVKLTATFAAGLPQHTGGLAIAAQSGAVGLAVLDQAARTQLGISSFVSLGNKADISGNDLLSYWFDDPATRAVALYLESLGNPRKFARIARAVGARKPVLVVKGGRSTDGQRAGASHTAAAAAPDIAVDALFAQCGVIRTGTLGELLEAARILVDQPLPGGNRVGIVGNAGGLGVLGADAAAAAGLIAPEVRDLGAGATASTLGDQIRKLASSGTVDAVVVMFGATRSNDPDTVLAEIATAADEFPAVTMAAVIVGMPQAPTYLGTRRMPVYELPEQVMQALGHAHRYAAWRVRPLGAYPDLSDVDYLKARVIVDDALAAGGGWQSWESATALLRAYRIPVLAGVVVTNAQDAMAAAERLGYPVALKAADPNLVHKTELGAVKLNLGYSAAVADAYASIDTTEALVQPMCAGGVEVVVGVVHDPVFGSLVMTGLGGIHTDLLGDRTFQALPMTDRDAAAMWRRLRGAPLLTGYRGSPITDTHALENVLLRVARLAEHFPEIAELDINPLVANSDGVAAIDVKLRLAPVGPEPDPTSRALRGDL